MDETRTAASWISVAEQEPPTGERLLLLTEWGVPVIGHWGPGYVAWCPMPRTTDRTRDALLDAVLRNRCKES